MRFFGRHSKQGDSVPVPEATHNQKGYTVAAVDFDENPWKGREIPTTYETFESIYKNVPWVRSCVDAISQEGQLAESGVTSVMDDEGQPVEVDSAIFTRLQRIFEQPNAEKSWHDILGMIIHDLETVDDAYLEIVDDQLGNPINLFHLDPSTIEINPNEHGSLINQEKAYIQYIDGKEVAAWKSDNIIHFRRYGRGLYGCSPLTSLAISVGTYMYGMAHNGRFFQNNATPRLHINLETASDSEMETFQNYIKTHLVGQPHKNLITTGKTKVEPIALKNSDMEFYSLLKWCRDEIIAIYKVPPMKIGLVETGKLANPDEQNDMFKKRVRSLLNVIQEQINISLIYNRFGVRNIKFKFGELDTYDTKVTAEIDDMYYKNNSITNNEMRRRRHLGPAVPWGDKPKYILDAEAQIMIEVAKANARADANIRIAQTTGGTRLPKGTGMEEPSDSTTEPIITPNNQASSSFSNSTTGTSAGGKGAVMGDDGLLLKGGLRAPDHLVEHQESLAVNRFTFKSKIEGPLFKFYSALGKKITAITPTSLSILLATPAQDAQKQKLLSDYMKVFDDGEAEYLKTTNDSMTDVFESQAQSSADRMGIDIVFDVKTQAIIDAFHAQYQKNAYTNMGKRVEKAMGQLYDQFVNENWSAAKLKREIGYTLDPYRNNKFKASINSVVNTELSRSVVQGNKFVDEKLGFKKSIWITANDEEVCSVCEPYHGQVWPINEGPYPPAHPGKCRCDRFGVI